jgi:hypothetical protein
MNNTTPQESLTFRETLTAELASTAMGHLVSAMKSSSVTLTEADALALAQLTGATVAEVVAVAVTKPDMTVSALQQQATEAVLNAAGKYLGLRPAAIVEAAPAAVPPALRN